MIVCATRDICADLYERIIGRRPDWDSDDITKGKIKVVYTGDATDEAHLHKHIRRPSHNKVIQQRAKSADDELELLIVQSMLLDRLRSRRCIRSTSTNRCEARPSCRPWRGSTRVPQQAGRSARRLRPADGNLYEALASTPPATRPPSRSAATSTIAVAKVQDMLAVIGDEILSGYDWRTQRAVKGRRRT